jgi:hypothetical protein
MDSLRNDIYDARNKIYWQFDHGIIYIVNEGRRKSLPSIEFWFCNCCVPLTLFARTLVINIGLSFSMYYFVDNPFLPLYCLSFFLYFTVHIIV